MCVCVCACVRAYIIRFYNLCVCYAVTAFQSSTSPLLGFLPPSKARWTGVVVMASGPQNIAGHTLYTPNQYLYYLRQSYDVVCVHTASHSSAVHRPQRFHVRHCTRTYYHCSFIVSIFSHYSFFFQPNHRKSTS